jgi:hypothetical protein
MLKGEAADRLAVGPGLVERREGAPHGFEGPAGLLRVGGVILEGKRNEEHASRAPEEVVQLGQRMLEIARSEDGRRAEKEKTTGKKPGGKPPAPPTAATGAKDQINLTDEDSRIMPVAGGGFEQAYNAQAAVAAGSMLVVAADVVQAANDKRQIEPMLGHLGHLPKVLGAPETLLADSGYFSAANVTACAQAKIAPLIAMGRERHHPSWRERFADAPPTPHNPTPLAAMRHRLATPEGKKLYALRKQIPEPVFGIIKSVIGFRQFSLRGLDKVKGEWSLVTMAWNIKRMFALAWV